MVNTKKNLSKKSLLQALEVLSKLRQSGVKEIHTRGALDRCIEVVKFPYLVAKPAPWTVQTHREYLRKYAKKTQYCNAQYNPIRIWLIQHGFLSKRFDGRRYHYTLTEKALSYSHSDYVKIKENTSVGARIHKEVPIVLSFTSVFANYQYQY